MSKSLEEFESFHAGSQLRALYEDVQGIRDHRRVLRLLADVLTQTGG